MLRSSAWRKLATTPFVAVFGLPRACDTNKLPREQERPPVTASATATVPPALLTGMPVQNFADASAFDGKTPYEQARAYEASGEHWLARLVLEKKALGPDGARAEIELLASLCHQQRDDACLENCRKRVGKKLRFDGGVATPRFDSGEHVEPDSDAARARDHLLKHRVKEARAILEPKVIDGKATKEEIRLLKIVCKDQVDRLCVALCDAKLAPVRNTE